MRTSHQTVAVPARAAELTGANGTAAVELTGIRKSYGKVEVLHGVGLTVRQGEHVVIFGPSGSGKSTMLRVMNLLEEPQSGFRPGIRSRVRPVMPVRRHPRQPATAAAHGRDGVPAV